jgi:myo-inositol-1(or 4)-monophosphatase
MFVRPALVNVMMRAAEKAGKSLRRDFGEVEQLQVSRKGPADFVSAADLKAQSILREELEKARPDFGFLMEEKDDAPDTSQKAERWIIDPLDGTTNFLHGVPHFAISIGVEREGELVAGLIYNPVTDETFSGEKGAGAFFNNKRMRVSGRKDLADCLMATGLPFKGSRKSVPQILKELDVVLPQVAGVRRAGAAALDLAYVAAGRFDAFWETGLSPWDMAAGIFLVREAGGYVSPYVKGDNPLKTGALIASNEALHDGFVRMIRGVQAG